MFVHIYQNETIWSSMLLHYYNEIVIFLKYCTIANIQFTTEIESINLLIICSSASS